jgi:hypothetical protein
VPTDPQGFAHWSDEEVEQLLRLIESGSSMNDLSRALGRSESDLERQARFLGVHIPQHGEVAVQTTTSDSSTLSATIHYAPSLPTPRRVGV